MSGTRTPLRKGFQFGLIVGLFGGSLMGVPAYLEWSARPEEMKADLASFLLTLASVFAFCFLLGFLAGFYTAPGSKRVRGPGSGTSLLYRLLDAVGWFFCRLVVGCLVGVLATFAYCFLIIAPCLALAHVTLDLENVQHDHPEIAALAGSGIAAMYSSWVGAVFGALLVTRHSPADRPPLASRAIRSSFLAFLVGILFGATVGWLPQDTLYFVVLAASVPIGILTAIVGGIWAELRQRRSLFPAKLESRI